MGVNRQPLTSSEMQRFKYLDALSSDKRRASGTQVEYMSLKFRFAIYVGKRS
jgi:hypothetical protein